MQTINKDELFGHVCQFLKAKGIELQEGAYTHTIKKGCQVLADTISLKPSLRLLLRPIRSVRSSSSLQEPSAAAHPQRAAAPGNRAGKRRRFRDSQSSSSVALLAALADSEFQIRRLYPAAASKLAYIVSNVSNPSASRPCFRTRPVRSQSARRVARSAGCALRTGQLS
jgi:hypothetical protein